ncbi:hypothetical protein MSG28_012446 [Choristoneura fumiferana]|uniref:Uncharacterized protein n=1 Tax=Choristoneura fumiferana TaxID=7141 RepID=A0ACC0KDL4_CHOFU|nr:hypothetical protein MSG28_012446 [Choristoneura fumiferana]
MSDDNRACLSPSAEAAPPGRAPLVPQPPPPPPPPPRAACPAALRARRRTYNNTGDWPAAAHAHAHAAAAAASAYDASKRRGSRGRRGHGQALRLSVLVLHARRLLPRAALHGSSRSNCQTLGPFVAFLESMVETAGSRLTGCVAVVVESANRGTSAYDTALYNAATMYVAQQNKTGGGGGWKNYNKSGVGAGQARRPKPPPKAQQLHYCDVCRISCAGPQTYKEHLEGQKHKKKEAAVKLAAAGAHAAAGRAAGGSALRCELCDVTCTGADAYAAHVRGIKHQKVVKLHTMLGKPIPSTEPTKIGSEKAQLSFVSLIIVKNWPSFLHKNVENIRSTRSNKIYKGKGSRPSSLTALGRRSYSAPTKRKFDFSDLSAKKTVAGTPKIAFVASGGLSTVAGTNQQKSVQGDKDKESDGGDDGADEPEVQPVGQDYIEEIRGDDGKALSFNCKLCDCKFNDPNAKEMHMKGRRHRLQYKKKVQPDLEVKTSDDRHVVAKHAEIYPSEQQLADTQRAVSHTERALKSLSDALAEQARPKGQAKTPIKTEDKKDDNKDGKEDGRDNQLFSFMGEGEGGAAGAEGAGAAVARALKGVMRVGLLAKGLLLKGDRDVRLVVLCHDRPTVTLLKRVATDLPHHLAKVKGPGDEPKYKVELLPAEGAVQVSDGTGSVLVSLTSAVMREPAEGGDIKRDDKDVLPRQKCLDALAALRHAKWFQARAATLQSCVIIIRIMRDLCRRIPNWTPLNPYSAGAALSPGEALRRVMEAVAGGLLLEHGPGLRDPCEKELVDALGNLPAQKREDLTASAQQFLRQIAFRQIYKVLDMEPLPKQKHPAGAWKFPRKRRRSHTDAESDQPNGQSCEDGGENGRIRDIREQVVGRPRVTAAPHDATLIKATNLALALNDPNNSKNTHS